MSDKNGDDFEMGIPVDEELGASPDEEKSDTGPEAGQPNVETGQEQYRIDEDDDQEELYEIELGMEIEDDQDVLGSGPDDLLEDGQASVSGDEAADEGEGPDAVPVEPDEERAAGDEDAKDAADAQDVPQLAEPGSEDVGDDSLDVARDEQPVDSAGEQTDIVEEQMLRGVFEEGFDRMTRKLDALHDEFSKKLKIDAYKDKLIDNLHRELQAYKNDLIKKHVQSMVMDIIKVIDDIRKLSDHYLSMPPEDLEPEKLLELLHRVPDDLEDLFYYQGVKPFACKGAEFDPTRQRVLKRVETDDPALDKTVAESLRPGYEWDEKVIRPEFVAVYLYKEPSAEEKIGTTDE